MRISSYDPSLINLGYAYGEIIDDVLIVECCGTFITDKFIKATGLFGIDDITTNRQLAVEYFIGMSTDNFKPDAIAGETSFYNGCNPSTIINQSKGLGLIERILHKYLRDSRTPYPLALYQPNVIKRTLGVPKEDFKDKMAINRAIEKLIKDGKIDYANKAYLPHTQLDHANDAVAMLYTLFYNITNFGLTEYNKES